MIAYSAPVVNLVEADRRAEVDGLGSEEMCSGLAMLCWGDVY